jgi:hypothetical protein
MRPADSTWAALRGPTPGTSSSQGAIAPTRVVSSAWSWSASACKNWMGAAVVRRARTVLGAPATWSAVVAGGRSSGPGWRCRGRGARLATPRGAPTIRALSWPMAATRAGGAASGGQQHPQGLPLATPAWVASCSWPRASRAARTASNASLLAPVRDAGRLSRPTSRTCSPRCCRNTARPAPKLPAASTAQTRRPGTVEPASPRGAGSRPRRHWWWSGRARRRPG